MGRGSTPISSVTTISFRPTCSRHGHPRSTHIPESPWQNGYAERLIRSIRGGPGAEGMTAGRRLS